MKMMITFYADLSTFKHKIKGLGFMTVHEGRKGLNQHFSFRLIVILEFRNIVILLNNLANSPYNNNFYGNISITNVPNVDKIENYYERYSKLLGTN